MDGYSRRLSRSTCKIRQPARHIRPRQRAAQHRCKLRFDAGLDPRVRADQVQCPRKHRRGRLVGREEQRHEFVADHQVGQRGAVGVAVLQHCATMLPSLAPPVRRQRSINA